jgi:hypothetical protein
MNEIYEHRNIKHSIEEIQNFFATALTGSKTRESAILVRSRDKYNKLICFSYFDELYHKYFLEKKMDKFKSDFQNEYCCDAQDNQNVKIFYCSKEKEFFVAIDGDKYYVFTCTC